MTRDERPAPVQLPDGGIAISASLCAELVAALTEYVSLLPPSRRAGRLARPVEAVLQAAREAAVTRELAQHRQAASWAAPTPVAPVVLGSAQPGSESEQEEWITTTQAADLAGMSAEWWRRLAERGTVRARRGERATWLLLRSDVVRYTRRPLENRRDRHPRHHRPTGPERKAS